MKKRRILTIEEAMTMTEKELDDFLENDEKLLKEGIGNSKQSNVDFGGKTLREIALKYGGKPMDEVLDNLLNKINDRWLS